MKTKLIKCFNILLYNNTIINTFIQNIYKYFNIVTYKKELE